MSIRLVVAAALAGSALLLAGCERPPVESTQTGYRGTGKSAVARLSATSSPPDSTPSRTSI
jgi:photosynthetic reaction center cytochrome c subunit